MRKIPVGSPFYKYAGTMGAKYISMNNLRVAFVHKEDKNLYVVFVGSDTDGGFKEEEFYRLADAKKYAEHINELLKQSRIDFPEFYDSGKYAKKNPLPRSRAARPAYINKRSQITKRPPSPRLKKRRAKNTDEGYFPNPLPPEQKNKVIAGIKAIEKYGKVMRDVKETPDVRRIAKDIYDSEWDNVYAIIKAYETRKQNPVDKKFDGFIATYTVSAELNRDYWVVLGKFADKKIAVDFAKMCAKQYPECAVEVTDNK